MAPKNAAAREANDLRKNVARKGCCKSELGNISTQDKAATKANLAAGRLEAIISHKSGTRKGRCEDESGKNSEHEKAAAKANYATHERADTKANLTAGALEAAILTTTAPEKAVAKAKWVGRCKSELGSRTVEAAICAKRCQKGCREGKEMGRRSVGSGNLRKNSARKGCCKHELGDSSAYEKATAKAELVAETQEAAAHTTTLPEQAAAKANWVAKAPEAALRAKTAPQKAAAKANLTSNWLEA